MFWKDGLCGLLDVDAEAGLKRKAEGDEWNRLDAYSLEFHQRVRHGYAELAKAEPKRWVIVDGNLPAETVQEIIRQVVQSRLDQTGLS